MHDIFDIVIGVSRFRICHSKILYCRYCLVYDNLFYNIYKWPGVVGSPTFAVNLCVCYNGDDIVY